MIRFGACYFFLAFGFLGCSRNVRTTPLKGDVVVISIHDLADDSVISKLEKSVGRRAGVRLMTLDRKTAEVTFLYDRHRRTPEEILGFVKMLGGKAEIGAGLGTFAPDVRFPKKLDVAWGSRQGERTALETHLAPHKVTVFTFYARWCGPCRELDEDLLELLQKKKYIALRRIFIEDWDSPVALQFHVTELPYVVVYSDQGKNLGEIAGYDPKGLIALAKQGRSR